MMRSGDKMQIEQKHADRDDVVRGKFFDWLRIFLLGRDANII
jgi:hypothetical protein